MENKEVKYTWETTNRYVRMSDELEKKKKAVGRDKREILQEWGKNYEDIVVDSDKSKDKEFEKKDDGSDQRRRRKINPTTGNSEED